MVRRLNALIAASACAGRASAPPNRSKRSLPGAEIGDLLRHRLLRVEAVHAVGDRGDEVAVGLEGDHVELDRVLEVGERIDDVVGRLHQPHRRVARMGAAEACRGGDIGEGRGLGGEDAEFHARPATARGARIGGPPGVFHEGGERRHAELHAAPLPIAVGAREDAEALRVAVEMREVGIEAETRMARKEALHPLGDHRLPGMAEGRVADVVGEAGGLHQVAEIVGRAPDRRERRGQALARHVAEGAADGGDLQRVDQAVADMRVGRQRVDLRLLLQPPEWAGEDDAVLVDLEGAAMRPLLRRVLGEAPRREKRLPVQGQPLMRATVPVVLWPGSSAARRTVPPHSCTSSAPTTSPGA